MLKTSMDNKELQTVSQDIIKIKDWSQDEDALTWVDVSIQNRLLKRSELAKLCSELDGKKRTIETWRQMYYTKREEGFEEYWLTQYKIHFKNKIGAKIYGRMDEVITKEKDLAKLVQVGEFLEGKKPGVAVQVNNFNADKYLEEA